MSGARVVGTDLLAPRRVLAQSLGLEHVFDSANGPTAEQIKDLTNGRGADVCIEATGSDAGAAGGDSCLRVQRPGGSRSASTRARRRACSLGEEFHHNRISVVCSQIGGIAPELQQRWDRERLVQTFMELATRGAVDCLRSITHRVAVRDAAGIYQLLDERPQDVLQAVLDFRPANEDRFRRHGGVANRHLGVLPRVRGGGTRIGLP